MSTPVASTGGGALGNPAALARLNALKAAPRKAGEASFFFYDAHFKNAAVKILPGEYFVDSEDLLVMTTLGSCIAACLWDRHAQIGGMNHFMLPEGAGDSGRYGSFAMELLINEMMKRGAAKSRMEAKIFGGGAVIAGLNMGSVNMRRTAEPPALRVIHFEQRQQDGAQRATVRHHNSRRVVGQLCHARCESFRAQRV